MQCSAEHHFKNQLPVIPRKSIDTFSYVITLRIFQGLRVFPPFAHICLFLARPLGTIGLIIGYSNFLMHKKKVEKRIFVCAYFHMDNVQLQYTWTSVDSVHYIHSINFELLTPVNLAFINILLLSIIGVKFIFRSIRQKFHFACTVHHSPP